MGGHVYMVCSRSSDPIRPWSPAADDGPTPQTRVKLPQNFPQNGFKVGTEKARHMHDMMGPAHYYSKIITL